MSEEINNETPNSKWASWALLQEAFKPGKLEPGSIGQLCAQRLQLLHGQDPDLPMGKRNFVLTTSCGHWGRGNSLAAAAKEAVRAGAGRTSRAFVILVLNDETPEVARDGMCISNSDSEQLNIGCVGMVGGILNTNKERK